MYQFFHVVDLLCCRIDTGLTSLIRILWRKIAENPPVLHFFSLYDKREIKCTQFGAPLQMDILTGLIDLMGKPRVGKYAKEALLIALSLHDARVDSFIIQRTSLIQIIVEDVVRRFQHALEAGVYPGNAPSTAMGGRPSIQPMCISKNAITPRHAEARPPPVDAFIKAVRFCNAVASVGSYSGKATDTLAAVSTTAHIHSSQQKGHLVLESILPPASTSEFSKFPPTTFARSTRLMSTVLISDPSIGSNVRDCILHQFLTSFLHGTLRSAATAVGEQAALASNSLISFLLLELASVSCESPLLHLTTQFLCEAPATGQVPTSNSSPPPGAEGMANAVISRALSVSKSVSSSSLQLLSLVLSVAPLKHGLALLMREGLGDMQSSGVEAAAMSSDLVTLTAMLGRADSAKSVEERLAHVCLVLIAARSHSKDRQLDPSADAAQGDLADPDSMYVDAAESNMLSSLAGRLASILDFVRASELRLLGQGAMKSSVVEDARIVTSASLCRQSSILSLILKKISSFQSLQPEEQVALSGLVERYHGLFLSTLDLILLYSVTTVFRCVCLLCTLTIASPETGSGDCWAAEAESIRRLDAVVELLLCVERLWENLRVHIIKVMAGKAAVQLPIIPALM